MCEYRVLSRVLSVVYGDPSVRRTFLTFENNAISTPKNVLAFVRDAVQSVLTCGRVGRGVEKSRTRAEQESNKSRNKSQEVEQEPKKEVEKKSHRCESRTPLFHHQ